jgi:predicted Zn finger-like uncharacterized protein
MQTHCPHCDTRFRVTETQINTADGFVRCGVCKEVFNAFDVAGQDEHQDSLLDEEPSENDFEESSSAFEKNLDIEANTEETDLIYAQAADVDNEASDENEVQPDDEAIHFNETHTTDESRKDAFDFFDETVNESLPHVVPDQFRESRSYGARSVVPTLLWGIGILSLTATLLIEYVWFNRDQFSQVAEFQTLVTNACEQFECKNIALRDTSKMELITRNVYSHPNEKDALIVDVTMKNNARFAQPYPVLQIDFSDIRGNTVAARRFLPGDYLSIEDDQSSQKQRPLLQPDTSTSITLEIQDPGKQAMTYEFNFL